MPIKSYLAVAIEGRRTKLQHAIKKLGCEVTLSENKNVLVVVTATENQSEDKNLFEQLHALEDLQLLTLVAAFSDDFETIQS